MNQSLHVFIDQLNQDSAMDALFLDTSLLMTEEVNMVLVAVQNPQSVAQLIAGNKTSIQAE